MRGNVRILSRCLTCTVIVAGVAVNHAIAQTSSQTAFRVDYAYMCYAEESQTEYFVIDSYLVTPWATVLFADEPTWSPDGTRIAVINHGTAVIPSVTGTSCITESVQGKDLFVISPFGGSAVNLTNFAEYAPIAGPAWSPDGGQIAFARSTNTSWQIYGINPDGSGLRRLTSTALLHAAHPTWSPDSARIVFECQIEAGNTDICVMNRDGTGLVRLTSELGSDFSPVWSPDGSRIVFSTSRFGADNVLALMNADGSGVAQIGTGIQGRPGSWSPDGARIAFTSTGSFEEICGVITEICYGYTPDAIYMTTPDGANVTVLADPGSNPAWMPRRPLARFRPTCEGLTCTFDASGSVDAYATLTSYAWNFGDGMSGTGATTTHTFQTAGNYQVRLTVIDSNGATGTTVQPVPLPTLVASFTSACSGLTCTFDASSSQGLVVTYSWSFGDGTSGAGATTNHTFGLAGSYQVALTQTDIYGVTVTTVQWIVVPPPVASFTFTCTGLTCTFDGSSSQGAITDYTWSFGDATVGFGSVVTHTYVTGGTYTVTLTIRTSIGITTATSRTVAPNGPPAASFTVTCNRLACSFNASGSRDLDGTVVSYAWSFGDGTTGAGVNTTHAYPVQGTYSVSLIVTDNRGATGAQVQSVTVTRQPQKH